MIESSKPLLCFSCTLYPKFFTDKAYEEQAIIAVKRIMQRHDLTSYDALSLVAYETYVSLIGHGLRDYEPIGDDVFTIPDDRKI